MLEFFMLLYVVCFVSARSDLVNSVRNNKLPEHHATLRSHAKTLKLYCRYLYTRPCMINHIWGLTQL